MTAPAVHNKIIASAARAALRPLGIRQKGRSRVWIDDGTWYYLLIEFQPSGYARGSYLNIAIGWLWYPKEYHSFDCGQARAKDFTEYQNDPQFEAAAADMAAHAAAYVIEKRNELTTLEAAHALADGGIPHCWPALHAGVLAALLGKDSSARALLEGAFDPLAEHDWVQERNVYIEALLERVGDVEACARFVEDQIDMCRAMLKLPLLERPFLPGTRAAP